MQPAISVLRSQELIAETTASPAVIAYYQGDFKNATFRRGEINDR